MVSYEQDVCTEKGKTMNGFRSDELLTRYIHALYDDTFEKSGPYFKRHFNSRSFLDLYISILEQHIVK
ncbi:MAG: hypothetical protein GF401_06735 [Chitinivibrionales bacterium]|nr:hypothetical protein [Chitinivibrionales bacterium]